MPYRLSPSRWPPYQSLVGASTGRYTYPSSSSTDIGAQTPVLPVYSMESPSHVSAPGSPGRGMVWNLQSCVPVRASKPRTNPGVLRLLRGRPPCSWAGPTMMTSPVTTGGELFPIVPASASTGAPSPCMRSTVPCAPNPSTGRPVPASSATRWNPGVTVMTRSSPLPSLQNATPRPELRRGARWYRTPSSGRQTHSVSPVAGSAATTARR